MTGVQKILHGLSHPNSKPATQCSCSRKTAVLCKRCENPQTTMSKLNKSTFKNSKRKSRVNDSTVAFDSNKLCKSYNRTKRADKQSDSTSRKNPNSMSALNRQPQPSFDSDLNSSMSIKFGMTGGSFEDSLEIQKSRSKCFVYKRSRIDKLVTDNISKGKSKQDRVTLKRIKEVEEQICKNEEISKLNQQVRLKNIKKPRKSIGRKPNEDKKETIKVSN